MLVEGIERRGKCVGYEETIALINMSRRQLDMHCWGHNRAGAIFGAGGSAV